MEGQQNLFKKKIVKYTKHYIVFLLLHCFFNPYLKAQQSPVQEAQDTSNNRVIVEFSDYAEGLISEEDELRRLVGNVQLRQDSTFMSCDVAEIQVEQNNLNAFGNVIIQQTDSTSTFADSLSYQGNKEIADLFDEVVLINGDQQLFTDRLNYNLNTRVAQYFDGAMLTDGETQLRSKRGYYYVKSGNAFFKDSVFVIDPDFELQSDTLQFNTKTKLVTFLGPTRINQNGSKIYCEGGFYDTENGVAEFSQNPQYVKEGQQAIADLIKYDGNKKEVTLTGNARFIDGDKRATADYIRYDEKNDVTYLEGNAHYEDDQQVIDSERIVYDAKNDTYTTAGRSYISDPPQILEADEVCFDSEKGIGIAEGNVIWQDTSSQMTINCEIANYNKDTDYLLATGGRPLLTSLLENDTLFMTSDTLISQRSENHDSIRNLYAYRDVRIFKSDLQVVCDSLVFTGQDSVFYFYDDPIVWSDTSQFSADTIQMKMNEGKLDTIFLHEKSFIVNSPDEILFNQIKGRDITAFFESNEIEKMYVEGNAESVYYIQDDKKAYIAVNKAICSDMWVDFGDNQVERIKCFPQPKANLTPIKQANHEELKLDGVKWEIKRRPKSLEDLF